MCCTRTTNRCALCCPVSTALYFLARLEQEVQRRMFNREELKDIATILISFTALVFSGIATWVAYSSQKKDRPAIEVDIVESRPIELTNVGVTFIHKFRLTNTGEKKAIVTTMDAYNHVLGGGLPRFSGVEFANGETMFDVSNELLEPLVIEPSSYSHIELLSFSKFLRDEPSLLLAHIKGEVRVTNGIGEILAQALSEYYAKLYPAEDNSVLVPLALFYWGRNCDASVQTIVEACVSIRIGTQRDLVFSSRFYASGFHFENGLTF